jgi:NADH-quinone oxidoreductase subunit E
VAIDAGRVRDLMARYPEPRSALLPLLWVAQEEEGWVSDAAVEEIASALSLPVNEVLSVITFYTMFRRQPPAERRLQVCRSLSCAFLGADDLLEELRRRHGERAADGSTSVEAVECLAACDRAPAGLFNERRVGPLDLRRAEALLQGTEPAGDGAAAAAGGHNP